MYQMKYFVNIYWCKLFPDTSLYSYCARNTNTHSKVVYWNVCMVSMEIKDKQTNMHWPTWIWLFNYM